MDIFKLFGTIAIKNTDANKAIDETTDKASSMASKIGSAIETAGTKITQLGKALAPVSTAMATVLTASVKSASDFTDGMAKMSTLFDTSQTSVSDLSQQFLELSNQTGISATELAEAGYQALSAGQDVSQVGAFVETAGNLAKAGFTSTTTAVDILTTAMNAYGDSAGSAEDIANKLVRTQNLGKTTVDELASAMGKVIPTASSMNVGIDQLTSGYVSLTKQGIATAEATTYMNSMFNELGDSGTTLGGIIKDKTGMSFQECMESGMSLADVLQITKDYADENGTAYNELWSSAEAGKAGLAILNGGVEEFNETVETMASDTDDVSEALDKLETPSVKAKKALNEIKNSGIELGTALLTALQPTLEKISGVIEKATTWFNGLDDETKVMIGNIMGVIAVASPVLIIGGKLISGAGKLVSSLSGLSKVFSLISSPIGIAVVAIGALIAVIVYLYNTNEDFRNLCNDVWNNVKDLISAVIPIIQEVISNFVENVKAFWAEWGDDIMNVVSSAWDFITNVITTAMTLINGIIKTITALINGDWETAWNTIKQTVSTVTEGIRTTIDSWFNVVKNLFSTGLGIALEVVNTKLNSIKNKFNTIMDSAKTIVSNAIEKIKSFFNFSWSLPSLKMPHISISGSFSLNPPSVPSFGISWYKKAMDNPFMFTKPTLFDMNPMTGTAKGAGEAGDEVMIGKDTMMNMIQESVAEENAKLSETLDNILAILNKYIPDLSSRKLVLDTGTLVGELASPMDTALGNLSIRKGRGL